MNQVNKDFGDVGGVGAGRIFTESYDVKAKENRWVVIAKTHRGINLPTDTNPVL